MICCAHGSRKQRARSDLWPHCQSDAGDEAARLRGARILLTHTARLR